VDISGKIFSALIAVVLGVLGAIVIFWVLNKIVEFLPGKWDRRLKPYVFVLPAFAVIGTFLLYPAVTTLIASFFNSDGTEAVGFGNYQRLLSNQQFLSAMINNVLWIIIAPAVVVVFGTLVAVLADRMKPTREKVAKSVIFLPMAISMVGAATIWQLMYAFVPAGEPQVGLLNGIVQAFGGDPVNWLGIRELRFNSILLMVVYIWTQVGFAMVLISAAIKGVPEDTIEAGRIDGAGELAIFFRIIMPQAWPTVITVFITVLIGVLKVFDIVYAMTNGQYNTDVIANIFFNTMFFNQDNGTASAIVVLLMIAVIPIMVYQVRQFRSQEVNR
jgi:alpha-glucoside transport system permease protein